MPALCPVLGKRRVLIVEDELLVAMELEDLLEDQGCEVLTTASTVVDALRWVEEAQPELVILDRNLNGEGTDPVAAELNRRGIPFVVVTGYVIGVSEAPAIKDAPCVQKPWATQDLIDQLSKAIIGSSSIKK